jgi:hypothetical protein
VLELKRAERRICGKGVGEGDGTRGVDARAAELQRVELLVGGERARERYDSRLRLERARSWHDEAAELGVGGSEEVGDVGDAEVVERHHTGVELDDRLRSTAQGHAKSRLVIRRRLWRRHRARTRAGARWWRGGKWRRRRRRRQEDFCDRGGRRHLAARRVRHARVQHELVRSESRLVRKESKVVGAHALGTAVGAEDAERGADVDELLQLYHRPARLAHAQREQLMQRHSRAPERADDAHLGEALAV